MLYSNISIVSIAIYQFLLSLIYFNYHLPFPIIGHYLSSISSYLVCSKPQHKVTSTILCRQFTILLYQMLEALGLALTITDAAFCFGSGAQYHTQY